MMSFWKWQCMFFLLLFYPAKICFVRAVWLPLNGSKIQLLGLFHDDLNFSDIRSESSQVRAMFKTAIILSQKYNITIDEQFIGWHIEQTNGNLIDGIKTTCYSILNSNIVGIIGPRLSREAHSIATFAENIGIPIVSYSATDPDLSNRDVYPTFYRMVPSDISAGLAITRLFIRFNWTSCIIIYQNDQYGFSGMRTINEAFEKQKFQVKKMIKFDITKQTIQGNLTHHLLDSGARIVLLWTTSTYTSVILQHAIDLDLVAPRFLWILSSSFSIDNFDRKDSNKLVGMLTIEPVSGSIFNAPINKSLLNAAYEIWQQYEPESFPGEDYVNQYALFVFDATWFLIQAVQQLCMNTINRSSDLCIKFVNSSTCFDRYLVDTNKYIDQMTRTNFLGVTGLVEYQVNGTDRSADGIYYLAQNIQLYSSRLHFVPVLQYSEYKSWEKINKPFSIIWPNHSCMVPSDRPILAGITLKIAMIRLEPFAMFTQDNKTTLTGYWPDLIELLQNKINFIPNFIFTPPNTHYSDLLQAVTNGTYDILIGDVTITAGRRELVSFSASTFDTSLIVVIKKPVSIYVDLFSYMRPFSTELWISIVATIVYASILMYVLERQQNAALRNRSSISMGVMSIWYCIGTVMGYGADFQAVTTSGRLLTLALYMLSLILVATYTANLASNLTKLVPKFVVNGIDDIRKGKVPPHRIGLIRGSAMEQYYLREISRETRNFYSGSNRQNILNKLLDNSIDATILDSSVAEHLTNNIFCNLTLVGGTFSDGAFGIVMPKNWPYAHELDKNILELRESGRLEGLRRKWFQTQKCNTQNEISTAIRLESMAGLFLIFGIISLFTLLPFIWRRCSQIKDYFLILKRRMTRVAQEKNSSKEQSNVSS